MSVTNMTNTSLRIQCRHWEYNADLTLTAWLHSTTQCRSKSLAAQWSTLHILVGNLAHNFMYVYFLCLSFNFDISNRLKV